MLSDQSSYLAFQRFVLRYQLRAISCEIFSSALSCYENMRYASAALGFCMVCRLTHSRKCLGDKASDAHLNLSSIMHMAGFPDLAVKCLEPILMSSLKMTGQEDATAHQFLWAISQIEDATPVAIELYRKLVACGDLRASHKLATLVDEGKSALYGDPEYARKVFDQLSDVFHQRITEQLGYRIPWLLEEQVSKALELRGDDCTHAKSHRILDLGSGSGLCGETFRSYVTIYDQDDVQTSSGSSNITDDDDLITLANCIDVRDNTKRSIFVAIDVSGKMIKLCKESGNYSHCFRCSLQDALEVIAGSVTNHVRDAYICENDNILIDRRFDIVLAADTFIYVGALGKVFKNMNAVLGINSLFAFSIELKERRDELFHSNHCSNDINDELHSSADEDEVMARQGCQLQSSSRYGHTKEYIEQLSMKFHFHLLACEEVVIRNEFDRSIFGCIYVLKKTK